MKMADDLKNKLTSESKSEPRFNESARRERFESKVPSHVRVEVRKDESIEKVIRKFKKLCEKEGIKKEVKARRFYEKPSDARRREARKKERNRQKSEKKFTDQKRKPKFKEDI